MSLLDIVSRASDEIGLPDVTQVIGNSDKNSRQLLQHLLSGGNSITQMINAQGGSWSVLTRIYEFTTTQDEPEYVLPSDFGRIIVDTAWQKDKYWQMRGSVDPRSWERLRNRQTSASYNVFRILRRSGNGAITINSNAPNQLRRFVLEPAPGDGETLVYEYVSQDWWVDVTGSDFSRQPDSDDDESVFGDDIHVFDLVWRWKKANGFDYAADLAEFEQYRDNALFQDMAMPQVPVGHSDRLYANKDESDVEWCP